MAKGLSVWEKLLEPVVNDSESFLQDTIVEIVGKRRVLIENHHGVIAYGDEKILVNVRYGAVSICGQKLELTKMTKDQLVVCGSIHGIALHRRDEI